MTIAILGILLLPLAVSRMVNMPSEVLLKVGERKELRCVWPSCPETVKFLWQPLEDKPIFGVIKSQERESVLTFENVTRNHENTILCKRTCGSETKQASTKVKVYSFPHSPELTWKEPLILGKESILTCSVSSAHPSEFFGIQMLNGSTVLLEAEAESGKELLVIDYRFKPSRADDGRSVACRASLDMDGIPPEEKTKETSRQMEVLSAPHNVRASEVITTSLESDIHLRCEAEGNPKPEFRWSALKPDGQTVKMVQHQELVIRKVSLADAGPYQCEASNRLGNQTVVTSVLVQGRPVNTTIKTNLQEGQSVTEGDSVNVSCSSQGFPTPRLVLGKEGVETDLMSSDGSEVSLSLPSVRLEHSGVYFCRAINTFGNQTSTLQLAVKAHPLMVLLQPDVIVAHSGSVVVLSCQASGCPQPRFFWRKKDKTPVLSRSETSGFLSSLSIDPVKAEDAGTYICEVACGSTKMSKRSEVNVFSFPSSPVIKSSGPAVQGETVLLYCSVLDVFPADLFHIVWMVGERELETEQWPLSSETQNLTTAFPHRVTAKDQNRSITCTVTLNMDRVPASQRVKTTSAVLSVHYPPRGTNITLSPNAEFKEGESVRVSCLSDSFPVGQMMLSRLVDGVKTVLMSLNETEASLELPSVELEDSGLYLCEVANTYGQDSDGVEITVKAPPRNTTVEVFPSSDVQEGQNVTICCRSVSFPPPAVVLTKLGSEHDIYSPDGVFRLINLTPNDTGLYQVNVTNHLGYDTEVFNINVLEKRSDPSPGWIDLLIPGLCLGVVASLLGFVIYVWRERKKGFYDLTKCV